MPATLPPPPPTTTTVHFYSNSSHASPQSISVTCLDYLRATSASLQLMRQLDVVQAGDSLRDDMRAFLDSSTEFDLLQAVDRAGGPMDPLVSRVVKLFELRMEIKRADEGGDGRSRSRSFPSTIDTELVKIEIGLMLLLHGSKSGKLDRAFRLLNAERSNGSFGEWSTEELKALFESILTAIVASVASSNELDVDQANELISQVSDFAVDRVVEYAGSADAISFNEFGSWYNAGGFRICPWLELLDLSKWTPENSVDNFPESLYEESPLEFAKSMMPPAPPVNSGSNTVAVSFDFPSSLDNPTPLSISITKGDLSLLRSTVEPALVAQEPQSLTQLFRGMGGSSGKISYNSMTRFAEELFPEEPSNLHLNRRALILTFFSLLDPSESGVLPCEDIAAGFTIFCGGNKSEKLAAGFDLFKEGANGLGRRGLWRFLRSFLAVLVSVSMANTNKEAEEMYDAVDHSAIWTARQIFDYIEGIGPRVQDEVDFEEFADWYSTGGGFKVAPWLELLDLNKLLGLQDEEGVQSNAEEEDGDYYDDDDEEEYEDDDDEDEDEDYDDDYQNSNINQLIQQGVLFSFPLAPSENQQNSTLYLTKHDVEYVRILVRETCFWSNEPDDVFGFFSEQIAWADTIDRESFSTCLNDFVYSHTGSNLDAEVLNVFDTFFSCYDLGGDMANLSELMWGLSLFCKGEKSSKLAFGFELFDSTSQSSLSDEQLYRFISSLLAMIFSCTTQGLQMHSGAMKQVVRSTSIMLTSMVMAKMNEMGLQRVSFDDFGDWYNEGGYEACPWLELLALRKWTNGEIEQEAEDDEDDEEEYEEEEEEEEEYEEEYEDEEEDSDYDDDENDYNQSSDSSDLTFNIHLPDGNILVKYTQDDIKRINELVISTGLKDMDFRKVGSAFIDAAEEGGGYISKKQFDECIRTLIPGGSLDKDQRKSLSSTLSALFYAFDRERSDSVDAVELASGFSIFCKGSKSDKLSYAWEIVDEDLDGMLSRRGTWRFARSFLTILLRISTTTTNSLLEDHASGSGDADFFQLVDSGAVWTAQGVFGAGGGRRGGIKFDDFADWYTEGGYETSSWLELLDLKKWCAA
ncbi:hypothetical protein TrST_g10588 [Triparma strigata]|uniref:Calmodulin n=1 Tax=Triparma strigata TaxID=1606541 RepID=A0A9W7A2E1_9STRA|nr:hypothetical protein TrST_g10588 [Triparma strigata]